MRRLKIFIFVCGTTIGRLHTKCVNKTKCSIESYHHKFYSFFYWMPWLWSINLLIKAWAMFGYAVLMIAIKPPLVRSHQWGISTKLIPFAPHISLFCRSFACLSCGEPANTVNLSFGSQADYLKANKLRSWIPCWGPLNSSASEWDGK